MVRAVAKIFWALLVLGRIPHKFTWTDLLQLFGAQSNYLQPVNPCSWLLSMLWWQNNVNLFIGFGNYSKLCLLVYPAFQHDQMQWVFCLPWVSTVQDGFKRPFRYNFFAFLIGLLCAITYSPWSFVCPTIWASTDLPSLFKTSQYFTDMFRVTVDLLSSSKH